MKGEERERRKGNGRKEGDERKRGDGDRGEMVKKEGQKELSQVRRGLVLCLSLILSHQTVAYGCVWCTRTLLLAIPEQSSLTYTPSNTCVLPYTTLNAHPHTHHTQFTHTPSSTTHKTHTSYTQLTHKYICTLAHPLAAPFTCYSPDFQEGGRGNGERV